MAGHGMHADVIHAVAQRLTRFEQRQPCSTAARVEQSQHQIMMRHIIGQFEAHAGAVRDTPAAQTSCTGNDFEVDPGVRLVRIRLDFDVEHRAARPLTGGPAIDRDPRFALGPAEETAAGLTLPRVPAFAQRDAGGRHDVVDEWLEPALRIDRVGARTRVQPQLMGPAVRHLLVEIAIDRVVRFDVVPIEPVEMPGPQTSGREVIDQFGREDDVDIRRQHEPASGAADANALGDHLEQRQHRAETQALVELGRHLDEAHRKWRVRRNAAQFGHPRLVRWWIPFHHDHLGIEPAAPALGGEGIDESLQALERIAAVIVVAGGHDDAQVRRRGWLGQPCPLRYSRSSAGR